MLEINQRVMTPIGPGEICLIEYGPRSVFHVSLDWPNDRVEKFNFDDLMPEDLVESRQLKWDRRFLALAEMVAGWSKDPSTKCGAVVVRPDLTVAGLGYNGFPRGCSDDPSLYANREEKYRRVVHAELNAILSAGVCALGGTIYLTPSPPCDRCAVTIIQAGIRRVVCRPATVEFRERWKAAFETTAALFKEASIEIVEIAP